jgi:hypothetical protein
MYNKYLDHVKTIEEPDYDFLIDDPRENCVREFNKEEFKFYISKNRMRDSWKIAIF